MVLSDEAENQPAVVENFLKTNSGTKNELGLFKVDQSATATSCLTVKTVQVVCNRLASSFTSKSLM